MGTIVKEDKCPSCLHRLNAATDPLTKIQVPHPGDFSVCFYCGQILRFDNELNVQRASEEDAAGLDPEKLRVLRELSRRFKEKARSCVP